MTPNNLIFGWAWILAGMLAGALIGQFFHKQDWLGGYDSWPRRMVRLGHIAFLGTGILNVLYDLSLARIGDPQDGLVDIGRWMMIIGAVTMPTTCFASARLKPARFAFAIPVIGLIGGTAILVFNGWQP